MTFTAAHEPALEKGRLCVVIATVVINVVAVSLLTLAPWSDWRTGAALNIVDNCLLVGFAVVRRDALLARFLLFGIAVGLAELPADAWLVDSTRTLDYSIGGGPMIWRSPLWMPLAWEVVAVQFGYIGLRLCERFGKAGLLMIGLLGAINIPFYEEMARRIHWWQYGGCRMISFTPWYIILGEFGIAVAFALLARMVRRSPCRAVVAGVFGGVWIFVCYAVAFLITDRLISQEMKPLNAFAICIAFLTAATMAQASVPIIVAGGAGRRAMADLLNKAEKEIKAGDLAGAKRHVEAILHFDPEYWPALYVRADILASQGQYQLAIQDCNEALRKYRGFVEASSLRATINVYLGKYAEALKEYNYLISLHPRLVTLARVLKQRAWLQSRCPGPAFRNGQQAVKDAKAACILGWKDENTIDTLAAAYAETGDFNSAVQYAAQALAIKGISREDSKRIQRHLESFQQHKPIRL